jgi:GAF domain-containing protein
VNNPGLLESIRQLVARTPDTQQALAEIAALLHRERPYYQWVGFYLLRNDTLELGPFVGKPTPHTSIRLHQGICGAAAASGQTIVVDDVNADPRYLACSLETRAEIVVPIRVQGRVAGEIDIDSDQPAAFTQQDRELLEAVAAMIGNTYPGLLDL